MGRNGDLEYGSTLLTPTSRLEVFAVEWVSPTDSYSTVLEMLHLPCLLSISVAVAVFVWLGLLRFMIGCINKSFAAMLCLCLFQCV